MQLCEAPPQPGDAVIVVDSGSAARSHIVSPELLPYALRNKFSTLIGDAATTGSSGSGVFDPNCKCLLGIMSRKFTIYTTGGDKDIAKHFGPDSGNSRFCAARIQTLSDDLQPPVSAGSLETDRTASASLIRRRNADALSAFRH